MNLTMLTDKSVYAKVKVTCYKFLKGMPKMSDIKDAKVKSLYKAIMLLNYFTPEHPLRSINELSELSGLLKSTVHNIMSTFSLNGIVVKDTVSGRYCLGSKIFEYYNTLIISDSNRPIVKSSMNEISTISGENVYLAIPSQLQVMYIDAAYPYNNFFSRSIIGIKADMYCTAVGKAMLAFLGDDYFDQIVEKGLYPYTPYTIINRNDLIVELEKIRQCGYAVDNMEHEDGIRCVAVPIFNREDQITAAISISGPSPRITDEKILHYSSLLLDAAKDLRSKYNL